MRHLPYAIEYHTLPCTGTQKPRYFFKEEGTKVADLWEQRTVTHLAIAGCCLESHARAETKFTEKERGPWLQHAPLICLTEDDFTTWPVAAHNHAAGKKQPRLRVSAHRFSVDAPRMLSPRPLHHLAAPPFDGLSSPLHGFPNSLPFDITRIRKDSQQQKKQ